MPKTPEEIAAEEAAKAKAAAESKSKSPDVPTGYSLVSDAEHNRVQAELRTLKAQQEATKAEAERIKAEASGEYQKALAAEQERRIKAETAANSLAVQEALRTEITRRGLAGEQAAAALRLADTSAIVAQDGAVQDTNVVSNSVESVLVNFKSLFEAPAPNRGEESAEATAAAEAEKAKAAAEQGTTMGAPKTPAAGPATPAEGSDAPVGFLSPEEYMATDEVTRRSPEFQKRVEASKHRWPSEVPATSFSVDS